MSRGTRGEDLTNILSNYLFPSIFMKIYLLTYILSNYLFPSILIKLYLLTYILANYLFPNLLPSENIFIIPLKFISFFCLMPVQLIVLHVSMIFYFHLVNPCLVFTRQAILTYMTKLFVMPCGALANCSISVELLVIAAHDKFIMYAILS